MAGAGAEPRREAVVDLSELADSKAAQQRAVSRPHEEVSDADLAAVEGEIKRRAKKVHGASPDDGIAPGAPSDAEVRDALREMRNGGAGAIRRGSGDMIWPINGAFTSPFGMRWAGCTRASTWRRPPVGRSAPRLRAA